MAVNAVNPNAVINAYSNMQGLGGAGVAGVQNAAGNNLLGGVGGQSGSVATGQPSFSDFLQEGIENSIQTMKSGEEMSAKAVAGEANLNDVVRAVTNAEITLQTVTAVRDKVISAYQDIMSMPI